ncbi:hypothetical protein [Paenibacillus flagellatus]|nr:hypothetical protein [Paenibacillus flagellatus]
MAPIRKRNMVVVVVTLAELKRSFLIDLIGGTVCYVLLRRALHHESIAVLGSMAGPLAIKMALRLSKRAPGRKAPVFVGSARKESGLS